MPSDYKGGKGPGKTAEGTVSIGDVLRAMGRAKFLASIVVIDARSPNGNECGVAAVRISRALFFFSLLLLLGAFGPHCTVAVAGDFR